MLSKKKDSGNGEHTPPDSTTKPSFYVNDEVLMQRKDGNFYLGNIVKIDWPKEQGLVKFGDNTESWSPFSRLTKLSTGLEVRCVKCKESSSSPGNEVIICDRCSRGYHQLCHVPPVRTSDIRNDSKWECYRCQDLPGKRLLPCRKSNTPALITSPLPSNVATDSQRKKLPYNLNDLQWDMHHRVNTEDKYCYCGGVGKWFLQMLQCGRCRQWFHARCILSLRFPLFFGDRFYVYICTLCNSGKEFLRRLELKWIDIVHLTMFNLTIRSAKKYLDVDEDILNFINGHWADFLLPPKLMETEASERRECVMAALNGNRSRFKYSREIKKRTTMWGLLTRVPPPIPVFSLPPNKPLTDQVLSGAWNSNARLKFLPSHPSHLLPPKNFDLYPDWERKGEGSLLGLEILHVDSRPLMLPKGVPANGHNVCIKSSSPVYPESRAQIERRIEAQSLENDRLKNFKARKSKKLNTEDKSPKERQDLPPTPPSSESNPEAAAAQHDSSGDESSSRGTLELVVAPHPERNNSFVGAGCLAPLPIGVTPILRPTKRRLSEKDIRVTSNGEIKRRKRRGGAKLGARIQLTDSNRARLRRPTRTSLSQLTPVKGSSPTAKPVPTATAPSAPNFNLEDLKSSVSHYFGAVNRIASGEKFTVRARRILPNGKTQYLIDWGCPPT